MLNDKIPGTLKVRMTNSKLLSLRASRGNRELCLAALPSAWLPSSLRLLRRRAGRFSQ